MRYTGLMLYYISGKRMCDLSYLFFCVLNFSVINVWCICTAFCIITEKKKIIVVFFPSNWQWKILKKQEKGTFKYKYMNIFNAISLDLLWQILLGLIYSIMAYRTPQGIKNKVNCSSEMYNFYPLPLNTQLGKQ